MAACNALNFLRWQIRGLSYLPGWGVGERKLPSKWSGVLVISFSGINQPTGHKIKWDHFDILQNQRFKFFSIHFVANLNSVTKKILNSVFRRSKPSQQRKWRCILLREIMEKDSVSAKFHVINQGSVLRNKSTIKKARNLTYAGRSPERITLTIATTCTQHWSGPLVSRKKRAMRLTLSEVPTRKTRPNHDSVNSVPYSLRFFKCVGS